MSSPQNYSVSKSSFLKYEQCAKAFFLHKNHPYLRDKLSIDKQLTFNRGHAVGELAQQLFPGGIDVSKETKNTTDAWNLTKELIAKGTKTIYEATFIFDKVLIMVDILHFENNVPTAYEVKSSLKVSETYLMDACLQYYVLKNSLQEFDDLFLVTLNGDYTFKNTLEPKQLFKKRSVKKEAEKNLAFFEEKVKGANLVLEQNVIPNINIGKQCFKPYQCDYLGTCWKNTNSENSIFNLPLASKDLLFEWNQSGVKDIEQIKDDTIENKLLLQVKNAFVNKLPIINADKILDLLIRVKEPVAALDMEVWSPAVPVINETRPFQQIPFLFCLTDLKNQSYFLSEYVTDERRSFAEELIKQTHSYASILVYDKTMEEAILNSLINLFEDLATELLVLKNKFIDLSEIIKNFQYYEAAFKNNFSLKTISEALKLEVSFDKIRSGLEAMNYFEKLRLEINPVEKQLIKEDLINYCFSDTKATFLLYEFLLSVK
jgi:hypothetical protein